VSFTEAQNNTSGTLLVSDGVNSASITLLGQYMANQFTSSSDAYGGTVIGGLPTDQEATTIVNPSRA
jgi:hypothetical protein